MASTNSLNTITVDGITYNTVGQGSIFATFSRATSASRSARTSRQRRIYRANGSVLLARTDE